jgi:hypothetical protein
LNIILLFQNLIASDAPKKGAFSFMKKSPRFVEEGKLYVIHADPRFKSENKPVYLGSVSFYQ